MKFTDETLMAYADGELDEVTRAAIERAMQSDPSIAARVAQHRALRERVYAAFAPMLDEPVPQRLQQPSPQPATAKVIALDSARAAKDLHKRARRWSWPEWGALAATLLVGVMAGRQSVESGDFSAAGGTLVAQGALATALSTQLASQAGDVRIGVSFVGTDGAYCRSFSRGATAGLACRAGERWAVPVVAAAEVQEGAYRQAAAAMPAAVLDAIDARIAGKTLDAGQEQAARAQGWRAAPR